MRIESSTGIRRDDGLGSGFGSRTSGGAAGGGDVSTGTAGAVFFFRVARLGLGGSGSVSSAALGVSAGAGVSSGVSSAGGADSGNVSDPRVVPSIDAKISLMSSCPEAPAADAISA